MGLSGYALHRAGKFCRSVSEVPTTQSGIPLVLSTWFRLKSVTAQVALFLFFLVYVALFLFQQLHMCFSFSFLTKSCTSCSSFLPVVNFLLTRAVRASLPPMPECKFQSWLRFELSGISSQALAHDIFWSS